MISVKNYDILSLQKGKMLTKESLRKKILEKLRNHKEEIRLKKSRVIKEKLFKQKEYKRAKVILFYMSFDGEVETREMIRDSLKEGKKVLVPVTRIEKKQIIPSRVLGLCRENLLVGPYNILQPKRVSEFPINDIDLVIAPGLAFDKRGFRLGRGKGYYDRFLKKISRKTRSIGLAFRFQILKHIPVSSHDLSVDKVIFA